MFKLFKSNYINIIILFVFFYFTFGILLSLLYTYSFVLYLLHKQRIKNFKTGRYLIR
jgi:hypothetical protein